MERGARSRERGAWRVESGVERGAWSVERGAWTVERGAWSVECGAWRVERGAWSVKPGPWNVDRAAWSVERGGGAWSWREWRDWRKWREGNTKTYTLRAQKSRTPLELSPRACASQWCHFPWGHHGCECPVRRLGDTTHGAGAGRGSCPRPGAPSQRGGGVWRGGWCCGSARVDAGWRGASGRGRALVRSVPTGSGRRATGGGGRTADPGGRGQGRRRAAREKAGQDPEVERDLAASRRCSWRG